MYTILPNRFFDYLVQRPTLNSVANGWKLTAEIKKKLEVKNVFFQLLFLCSKHRLIIALIAGIRIP